jgi:hypothetical protein
MDLQFDMIAADMRAYPWWKARRSPSANLEAGPYRPIKRLLG